MAASTCRVLQSTQKEVSVSIRSKGLFVSFFKRQICRDTNCKNKVILAATLRGSRPAWWGHNSETTTDREKRRPHRPMKSSELSNGENRIAVRQILQNRKLRHWWRHNLGSRWKLQKMARENFSIGAFYNITKNQDNTIKIVGRDSFLSHKTPKNTSFIGVTQPPGVAQPLYSRGHN